ncbi:ankyrin repeat domain-containing protein [Candidatus Tisiphia endosymbiont of Beris chalybata]|uniref:ankyrin repeat domain-containing protein n=1 Tax=Candidatus Tisiphia endosymbiont of Beris chalybata TaxID=3066262 RepID=UPI00312C9BEC
MTEDEIALLDAAKKGDIKTAKELLDKDVDPNVKNSNDDTTALLYIVQRKDLEMAKMFVAKGADVNYGNKYEIPVCEAARINDLPMVTFLLESGADANQHRPTRYTALKCAITALKCAIMEKNIPMIKVLLQYKADINIESPHDGQAIHSAAASGNWEIVELFRDVGADINAQDSRGQTPMYYAARMNDPEMIKKLAACDADPNIGGGQDGWALHAAILRHSKESTKLLLNLGANPNTVDRNGKTPVQLTTAWGRTSSSADMTALLEKFKSVWSLATCEIDTENKQLILENGPVHLQLPDNQDLDPKNLSTFTKHYIKDLVAKGSTPIDISKKLERLNSNLIQLSCDSDYSNYQWVSDLQHGLTSLRSSRDNTKVKGLAIQAAKVINKHLSQHTISNIFPPLEQRLINTVGGKKGPSSGPSI